VTCEANPHPCSDRFTRSEIYGPSYSVPEANETFMASKLGDDRFIDQSLGDPTKPNKEANNLITVISTNLSASLLKVNIDVDWNSPSNIKDTTFNLLSPQPLSLTSCSRTQNLRDENIYSIDKSKKLLTNPLELYEKLALGNETLQTAERKVFPILWTSAVDDPYTLVALTPDDRWSRNISVGRVCTANAFWRKAKTTISKNGLTQIRTEMPHYVQNIPNDNFEPILIRPILPNIS
jgi:hypothetical protein